MQDLLSSQDAAVNQTGQGYDETRTVYIKDLRVLKDVNLSRVVIVDNQLLSFAL